MNKYLLALLRILIGWIFLWAFLDKIFGLGFGTKKPDAFLAGKNIISGFLLYATKGPFSEIFQTLAYSNTVQYLFLAGLLFVGIAFIFGITMRLASITGVIMMILIYLASFPPPHNPFVDEHIIYVLILITLQQLNAGQLLGLGSKWQNLNFVKTYSILK